MAASSTGGFPRKLSEQKRRCMQSSCFFEPLLDSATQQVFGGQFGGSQLEDAASLEAIVAAGSGTHAAVYGELPYTSATKLFVDGGIYPPGLYADDVFCDLGSGTGKLVMQAFLTTRVRKAIGVELGRKRHETSRLLKQEVLKRLFCQRKSWSPSTSNREVEVTSDNRENSATGNQEVDDEWFCDHGIEFRCDNILTTDVSDATVVFYSSLMFDEEFIDKMAVKISRECTKLRYLITLTPIGCSASGPGCEDNHVGKLGLSLVGTPRIRMGWSDKQPTHSTLGLQPVYIYVRATSAEAR
ncbi:unnamed protein product, partial [Amoebophrya sp. A25]|eukprot:GSA25T00000327001.1